MEAYTKLINEQRICYQSGKTRTIAYRKQLLEKLKAVIKRRNQDIQKALRQDFGKCGFESFSTEIMGVLDEIDFSIRHVSGWEKPKRVRTPITLFCAKSTVYREPYGNVLIISPWNYPFLLAFSPLVGAIAAGNCCILKPSEYAPHTSRILKEMITECFPKEVCAVIEGGAKETTELLKERFDFIFYTGSTRVGKIIAKAAAEHLTPVVLELGGKSPCIVDETADIKVAAKRIVWGKFLNGGQTCVAPDYLLVQRQVKPKLLAAMKQEILHFYGDDPKASGDYCRIISPGHFDRLAAFLEAGTVYSGGQCDHEERYIEPTILTDITWELPVMQEEIFGPILPVLEYDNIEEVVRLLQKKERPLALYIFTGKKSVSQMLIRRLNFGGGGVNTLVMHVANGYLPFGGIGASGMGMYHGKWSYETFTHAKAMMDKTVKIDLEILYPPYGNRVRLLERMKGIK